jgi:mevalonate kinase
MKARAHGKIIISGEHSVVYGYPALVTTTDLFREVELIENKVEDSSDHLFINLKKIFESNFKQDLSNIWYKQGGNLPIGSGLGSSAAFAAACFKALASKFSINLSQKKLFELVQESEKFAHGNPSGIDATAVVYGGLLEFRKTNGKFLHQIIRSDLDKKLKFRLVDSGKPLESTKEMVFWVKENLEKNKKYLAQMGKVSQLIIENLKKNTWEPELLTQNERLLEKIGVVGNKAKKMISKLEKEGKSAKITGAGGMKSGSGIIIYL